MKRKLFGGPCDGKVVDIPDTEIYMVDVDSCTYEYHRHEWIIVRKGEKRSWIAYVFDSEGMYHAERYWQSCNDYLEKRKRGYLNYSEQIQYSNGAKIRTVNRDGEIKVYVNDSLVGESTVKPKKPWFASKTLWFGVTVILTSFVEAWAGGADAKTAAITVIGATIIVLRKLTKTGI